MVGAVTNGGVSDTNPKENHAAQAGRHCGAGEAQKAPGGARQVQGALGERCGGESAAQGAQAPPESLPATIREFYEAQIIFTRAAAIEYAKAIATPTSLPTASPVLVSAAQPVDASSAAMGGGEARADLEALICSFDWPCDRAIAIFACESVHFRPDVVYGPTVSATNDRGITQTNAVHAEKYAARGWNYYTDAFVPTKNLTIAYQIYDDMGGFSPWTCSRLV